MRYDVIFITAGLLCVIAGMTFGIWIGTKNDAFDTALRARFLEDHFAAARGELGAWKASADGALALLLLLDQFPRNAFRGTAHAFATDPLAVAAAERAIDAGFDRAVDPS